MLPEVAFGYSLLHLQPFFLIFCLLLDDIIHCIVLIFVYIYSEFISGKDTRKRKTNRTFSAPSPYQGCTFLAPCLHQPCTKYARQSGSLCSEHAGFTHHQPAESGAALPALKRTKSEGRAKEERTRSEGMPPKPVSGDPQFGCWQLSENSGSCHKTKGLRNKNTHSPAVTKMFSIELHHALLKIGGLSRSNGLIHFNFQMSCNEDICKFP